MTYLRTEIEIDAPRNQVWQVLTSFEEYPSWNPFLVQILGELQLAQELEITVMNKSKKTSFRSVLIKVQDQESFEWQGSALMGAFKGRHYFILEDLGNDQTRLIHGEHFSGLLSGLVLKFIGKDTEAGFKHMNEALKERAESIGAEAY